MKSLQSVSCLDELASRPGRRLLPEMVYLDTSVVIRLASEGTRTTSLSRLQSLVDSGIMNVYSSIDVLEELAPEGIHTTSAQSTALDIVRQLAPNRILFPSDRLMRWELQSGKTLDAEKALLSCDLIRKIWDRKGSDGIFWQDIDLGVRKSKETFLAKLRCASESLVTEFLSYTDSRALRQNAGRGEINETLTRDWALHFLDSNQKDFGLPVNRALWPDVGSMATVRAYLSYYLALIHKHHASDDAKYSGSDQYDLFHYTNAACVGCLITIDRRFRNTIGRIEWMPVPVLGLDELNEISEGGPI